MPVTTLLRHDPLTVLNYRCAAAPGDEPFAEARIYDISGSIFDRQIRMITPVLMGGCPCRKPYPIG